MSDIEWWIEPERSSVMKHGEERKEWLREQLADKSECQLFNFGEGLRGFDIHGDVIDLLDEVASARAIMQRFVDKVDSGLARSTETYAEMKQWMEDE